MSEAIIKGKIKKPFNVVLFGTPGIGKSTWAASAPAPIFLGAEENDELEVDRFPYALTFDDFIKQLTSLVADPKGYKTVVVDTLDSVEKLLHTKILNSDPKKTGSMMSAFGGYGKAYEKAESEMIVVRSLLKALRDKHGLNVILLAHAMKAKATDTILGLEYDTYEIAVNKKAQAVFVDWVSAVLFANYVATKKENDNSDRVFAMSHGQRIVYTEKRPGHLGKNRYELPYEMDLDFQQFFDGYNSFYAGVEQPASFYIEQIKGLVININDVKLVETLLAHVEKNKEDVGTLKKSLARVRERIG